MMTEANAEYLKAFIREAVAQELSLALSSYKRALLEKSQPLFVDKDGNEKTMIVTVEDIESVGEGFGV